MIRVLQVVDHMGLGGIQAFIMNVYKNIDRSHLQFDFLVHEKFGNAFAEEIESLGGVIHYIPARNKGLLKNKKALDLFFKTHPEYKVVHQHESSLSYIEPLVAARKNGVPIRIIHSHSTRMGNNRIHKLLHYFNAKRIHKVATHYLACGDLAGKWFYSTSKVGLNFTIVINGIRLKDFAFNEMDRLQMRENIGLGNSTTYCHIGRFDWVKNHTFLIEIFSEIEKIHPNSKLVLVGNGVLMDKIRLKVIELGLASKVIFLGFRSDINMILQAVDSVLLPSIYEGFPVTAIEAQAAGLPFFMSDTVSKEALINENSISIPLDSTPKQWAKIICSNVRRIPNNAVMYEKGFDISQTVLKLTNIYFNENYNK